MIKSLFEDVNCRTYFSVSPVKILHKLIDGQSIRPAKIVGNDSRPFLAIHVGAFNARHRSPVGEEEIAELVVDRDGSRCLEVLPDENFSIGAVEL